MLYGSFYQGDKIPKFYFLCFSPFFLNSCISKVIYQYTLKKSLSSIGLIVFNHLGHCLLPRSSSVSQAIFCLVLFGYPFWTNTFFLIFQCVFSNFKEKYFEKFSKKKLDFKIKFKSKSKWNEFLLRCLPLRKKCVFK